MRRLFNSAIGRIVHMVPPKEILDGYEHPQLIEIMFRKARDFRPRIAGTSSSTARRRSISAAASPSTINAK